MKALRVADLFCGAGGSSTGAMRAIQSAGRQMRLTAVNHWDVAIETHSRNHPKAEHHCSNVYRLSPRDAVPRGRLDLLMASPTCTFHSRARGGKPISRDQRYGRMTPTQVLRWATELRPRFLLVENVPEFINWGPVHLSPPTRSRCLRAKCKAEKPCKASQGYYFRPWVRRLEALGYRLEWRILNAANYGDATTRRRFFLIGRLCRGPLRWPNPTHSKTGEPDLFGAGQARWRGACEIIDWSLLGSSIFSRSKPLSPNTLRRIYAGLVRFRWPDPYLVVLRQHMDALGVDTPVPTITAGGTHVGLVQPLVARTDMHKSNALCVREAGDPIPTVTTGGGLALVIPQNGSNGARSSRSPAPTITTTSRGIGLVIPQHGGGIARDGRRPVPTITTDGAHALVTPVTHHDRSARGRSIDEPLPTITGANRGELAFIVASNGERKGQRPRTRSVERPAPTICATGRVDLVQAGEADLLFRMLQPHELAAAMGFGADYDFAGTKTDVTKQIGNAVPVGTSEAIVAALLGLS